MEQCSVLFEYFQGFFLKGLELDRESAEYVFTLEPEQNAACTCCRCGRSKLPVHDRTIRRVRDLPVFGLASIIEFPRRRVL
ncbi:transposase family protein, partial [bacterium]|nr:transposase family protein [bacterium]